MMLFWRILYWMVVALFILAITMAVIISSAVIYWISVKILSWWIERGGSGRMKCPKCGKPRTRVWDTRKQETGSVRRKRRCRSCGYWFKTWEYYAPDT